MSGIGTSRMGASIDDLKKIQQTIAIDALHIDPLARWYELVRFVSLEKKKDLKGHALLAQTLYSMEYMLRLFYEELTGDKLNPPDELIGSGKESFYGKGVIQDELQYLEFLTNQYRLNPKPKLILIVEGDGEAEQFPRLAQQLFGCSFPRSGIQIMNLKGIGNFTGSKIADKYGALEKLIDDYHNRQTIAFIVLDNEGRVSQVKRKLLNATSKYYPKRKVTTDEFIFVWGKNIEFDNFSDSEIAQAMTEQSQNKYTFLLEEIKNCRKSLMRTNGNPLNNLFREKVNIDLSKVKLLGILCGYIIKNSEEEFSNGKGKRPLVQIIQKTIKLAALNHQPARRDTWIKNQEALFGDSNKK
jgi:hypothetical protein